MSARREEAAAWLAKAEGDLRVARHVRAGPGLPGEIVGFHLQQAAEKALKGLLVAESIAPPRTHDLRALLAVFPSPVEGAEADTAEALTPFAVLSRYPGFAEQPDDQTVAAFLAFAQGCVDRLRRRVDSLSQSGSPPER